MAEKKVEWGFDLSGFRSRAQLEGFMKKHKCRRDGSKEITVKGRPKKALKDYEAKYRYYFWKCPGFAFTTGQSGTEGYLGYVGAEINPEAMPKWRAFRNDFKKSASVKDESPHKNDFISPPSEMRKRPKIDWI